MKLHGNARTCLHSRQLIVRRVLEQGWTLAQAAEALGMDEGTWGRWERGEPIAWQRYRDRVEAFLGPTLREEPIKMRFYTWRHKYFYCVIKPA